MAALDRQEFRESPLLAYAFASTGRRDEALGMLKTLTKSSFDFETIALTYFALGENDRGFEWLTRAFDERQPLISYARWDRRLDSLRSDPRFRALVARLKLPE